MNDLDAGEVMASRAIDRGTGPPVVFLHGAWLSGAMWRSQIERFGTDYRAVALDVHGHGRSNGSSRRDSSVERFASALRTALETLEVDAPVLCGLSLGGLVAKTYARDHPVRGLVLAGTVRSIPPVPMTRWQQRTFFPKPAVYPTLRALGSGGAFRLLLRGVEASLGRPWLATTPEAREYALGEVDRTPTAEFVEVFDALYDFEPPDLSGLDARTLVIHGDHEAPAVKAQNRSLARRLDAERVTVEGAGHLANMDRPARFDAAVAGFLGDLSLE